MNPETRGALEQTREMTDAERDAHEERRIAEDNCHERLREQERLVAIPERMTKSAIRYDAFGYPIPVDHADSIR